MSCIFDNTITKLNHITGFHAIQIDCALELIKSVHMKLITMLFTEFETQDNDPALSADGFHQLSRDSSVLVARKGELKLGTARQNSASN